MVDVRAEEESLVQRLRLGEGDQTDEGIQRKLDEIFRKSLPEESKVEDSGVLKSLNSLHSLRCSLMATTSRVMLDNSLRDSIKKGYDDDSR